MEKKKLKLSISGSRNKTINSIEQARNQSKNTVVIEKKPKRFLGKSTSARPFVNNDKFKNKSSLPEKTPNFSNNSLKFCPPSSLNECEVFSMPLWLSTSFDKPYKA